MLVTRSTRNIMTSVMCINSLNDIPAKERNLGIVVDEVPLIGCEASYLRDANPEVGLNETYNINSLENCNKAKDGHTPVAQVALYIHLPTEDAS